MAQIPEVKSNFQGGLNLDDSLHVVPLNAYVDALNVTRNALEGNNDNIITNIIGNRIVPFAGYPSGAGTVIGSFPFKLRNTVIYFRYNENGYHGIYQYDNTKRIISKIFENLTDSGGVDILGFTENDKITSINVFARDEGDLLFFLDSLGRPTELDISKFLVGYYTPVTRAIIDVAKKPPLSPPQAVYGNDLTVRSNYFKKNLFRFKTRWIYDSFEKSAWSPISEVPLPINILDDAYTNLITNNNVIQLTANTGDKNVSSVEIAVSWVNGTNNWSDFASVAVVNKTDLVIQASEITTVGTDGTTQSAITFSGNVTTGTVISIYLTQIPSTDTLIATYTTVSGDTPSTVANYILASLISYGIAISPSVSGAQVLFYFYTATYIFGRVDINTDNDIIDNIFFPYSFYNDSTYPTVDVGESILLYDYVPPVANAQEMANGNVLVYGGITEGYNKDTTKNCTITIETVSAGNGGVIGSLNAVITATSDTSFHQINRWDFTGIPAAGTVVTVQGKLKSTHVVTTISTYTTVAGDTPATIAIALVNSAVTVIAPAAINVQLEKSTYEPMTGSTYSYILITPPPTSSSTNSIATWLPSSQRQIARAYFDEKGVTNGILYTDKVSFPAYNEDGSHVPLLAYINYKINDVPPEWAYSMQFYFTKDDTVFLVWESLTVNKTETEYIYFEVTSLITNATKKPTTAIVCSYSFTDGDRVKVWKDVTTNTVLDYTYDSAIEGLVVDPSISGSVVTGTFIKIKNVAPFTSGISASDNYVLFIYTPSQQLSNSENQVFYECGRQYNIIDPTLPTRSHGGQVTDQVVGMVPAEYNFYEGDVYFRSRTIASTDSGYTTFNVFDNNFVDFYISAVNSINGRASIIDTNAKKQYFPTLIRFGQAYQADTNINGLNRFYPLDFDEYDYSKGSIVRIRTRDRFLKIFQQFKIGRVPLYSQITKDPSGTSVLIVSDKLLNPIEYRVGDFGLSAPESLASWDYADYGCDTSKGVVWRDSQDGTEPISQLYKIDSWAITELPLRTGDKKIYGAFYPFARQYILALEASICTPIIVPDFSLPDAVVGVAYSQTVTIIGSSLVLIVNDAPTWMAINLAGQNVVFSGTPLSVATGISVSFNLSNECSNIITTNKTINVDSPPCVAVSIIGTPSLPNATVSTPYMYDFYVSGTAPFTTGTVSESWMSATVSGNRIQLSGTPITAETETIAFTISNDCGSVDFSQPLVIENNDAMFTDTTFVYGDTLQDIEIANLKGKPAVVVTITLDTLTNSNGGTLKVNGAAATVGDTWNVTLGSDGTGILNVAIYGVTNPGTGMLGHFTITAVSSGGIGPDNTYIISKAFS